jgi:hypothetical protein
MAGHDEAVRIHYDRLLPSESFEREGYLVDGLLWNLARVLGVGFDAIERPDFYVQCFLYPVRYLPPGGSACRGRAAARGICRPIANVDLGVDAHRIHTAANMIIGTP